MEEGVREVLHETRRHASGPCSINYPPQQQLNESVKWKLLSLLSTWGVSQLKEKWIGSRHPRKIRKWVSLFVSPMGERVAIALGNQIIILQKDDDYQEPSGLFTSSIPGLFTAGVWSESHDVLGVADNNDILYFIKANGEEITRMTKLQLKVSLPIIGLISEQPLNLDKSCLCTFNVLTSDGSLHEVEISHNPRLSARTSSNGSQKEFPDNIFCLDYHYGMSLFAVVGGPISVSSSSECSIGTYSLSLWRRTTNLDLERMSSTQFEGLYSVPKGYVGQLTSPKVLISPKGQSVAALDLRGCLCIFKLDNGHPSVLKVSCGDKYDSEERCDIVDFTWWSNHILALVKRNGVVTMINALTDSILLRKDHVYSFPVLQSPQLLPGHLFLLENLSKKNHDSYNITAESNLPHTDLVTDENYHFDFANLQWSLFSFSKRCVSEMYEILISEQKYQAALDFANLHGLDTDEVLKSQWLHSSQGTSEVSMFLSSIKDQDFVLSQCVDRVGPTEDAVRALISHGLRLTSQFKFSESGTDDNSKIWDFRIARLKLLQFRDKLETFLGTNMGRFSMQEYKKFCSMPVNEAAARLAESGKIGALNLIFKRHPYSLTPFMLEILAAIPETVPVQSYWQLLPGNSPPSSVTLREEDWVECQEMVNFISRFHENCGSNIQLRTEPMMKQCSSTWPSTDELCTWYKSRARDMDSLSGQLDNSLYLVDFACQKGIYALQRFHEDISYLHQLIYTDDHSDEETFTMRLVDWEHLPDYEKFKTMLRGVTEENGLGRLHKKAIPFMRSRFPVFTSVSAEAPTSERLIADKKSDLYVVQWLKEIASENKLDICLKVIEEGNGGPQDDSIFRDKAEAVDCALQCIYLCTSTDKWNTMASILSKLPATRDPELSLGGLNERVKLAEGHVEAGRLLSVYQVPKPIKFFLEAHSDGKGVKHILRLILSKFVRRQPGHADNDWASLWRDFQSLQEKAFTFLDKEFMLMEFCRGLLKAGKFSLARNYLRGTASVALATDKAENLVIQAAREYFFSASSLSSPEIWKARECLNLLPSSRNVRAEADIIDALTVKLPNLGVNILPIQFRQIKDPMEVIKLAITSQIGAYLNVDELIEISKLLGLNSQDEISAVQEAIAREAAVAGDLQLAFDLCLLLAKKGHGVVWDLCAAMARGPDLENVDVSSRKQLLGFALSYCDEQSIGELLHAWKDIDMQDQCEKLTMFSGTTPNCEDSFDLQTHSGQVIGFNWDDQEAHIEELASLLSLVANDFPKENGSDWQTLLPENGKLYSFAASWLPWLLGLSRTGENVKKLFDGPIMGNGYVSIRTQATVTILSWLARNGFAPRDDLISSLAKSIMEPPVTEEEDIIGTSFLLNLVDAFHGVEIIEEQLRTREVYNEICSIMNVGMLYSLLHNSMGDCEGPAQRRELLLRTFKEKHSFCSDDVNKFDRAQTSFWREWKLKLEEKMHIADQSRMLEQIIPGVESTRFLSGDVNYRESVILSLVESLKLEKKFILKDLLRLAFAYGLDQTKVLVRYLCCVLLSEAWSTEDITAEISEFINEILASSAEVVKAVSVSVFPAIDGHDKQRLAFIFGLLSNCYFQLEGTKDIHAFSLDPTHLSVSVGHFYKVIEQECHRVSFIRSLNFKNVAALDGLNFKLIKSEIYANIDEHSVEALATMIQNLSSVYSDPKVENVISSQDVYKHHVSGLLNSYEVGAITQADVENPGILHGLLSGLEQVYDVSKKYIRAMAYQDALHFIKRFFTFILSLNKFFEGLSTNSTWRDPLVFLVYFWLRVIEDCLEFSTYEAPEEKQKFECLLCCLKVFTNLVVEGSVSPSQGWGTVIGYVNHVFESGFSVDIIYFCREMVFCGCEFHSIAELYHTVLSQLAKSEKYFGQIQDLSHLYLRVLESTLNNLGDGSDVHRNLVNLLSSLSRMDGDVEDLKRVRHAVWERMANFSNDLMVPNRERLYALELMQSITSSDRTGEGFSTEMESNVSPWENWDDHKSTFKTDMGFHDGVEGQTVASSRLTSALVALKSSQLARPISHHVDITPDDLSTVESAVSCFLRLCRASNSEHQIDALVALLGVWEGLFASKKEDPHTPEPDVADDDWGNDDWDEGWKSFQEETVEKEMEKVQSLLVHPLHSCWVEILKKMVALSQFEGLVKLIDQSMAKTHGVLLNEDGGRSLIQILLQVDCFIALKVALLFPYEAIRKLCLDEVEEKLKREQISDTISKDHTFFILVIASGLMSKIISDPSYGTTFSFLSFMVGNFSRKYQEVQLSIMKPKDRNGNVSENKEEGGFLLLFGKILFPCFVSELVTAGQVILAGFLVVKFMHINTSLSLINVTDATLKKYLQTQLQALEIADCTSQYVDFGGPLVNTIYQLRGRMGNLIQSALSSLAADR